MKAENIEKAICRASAVEGIKAVLSTRFQEMCKIRESGDLSEAGGVHDLRVASRRLRSALRDFRPFLQKKKIENFRENLKAVADALGAVRDQDVAVKALEEIAADAPTEVEKFIKKLADERREMRDGAFLKLEKSVSEDAFADLQKLFLEELEKALKSGRRKNKLNAFADIIMLRQAARFVIESRWQEFVELSDSLNRPADTEPLHRFRIAAKRLRYTLELFSPCWADRLSPFAKEIAKLQTALGKLHDGDVWLTEFDKRRSASSGEKQTLVWLTQYFTETRQKHLADALDFWRNLEKEDFAARLSAILQKSRI